MSDDALLMRMVSLERAAKRKKEAEEALERARLELQSADVGLEEAMHDAGEWAINSRLGNHSVNVVWKGQSYKFTVIYGENVDHKRSYKLEAGTTINLDPLPEEPA